MFSKLRNRMESEEGFTLIELLVVILIIGILAAIAIPSFLNQRTKGQDACAKAMTKQMQTAMKTAQIDTGTYAGITSGTLQTIENSIQAGQCGSASTINLGGTGAAGVCSGAPSSTGFCVASTSASGTSFALAENNGVVARTCSAAGTGACSAAGDW